MLALELLLVCLSFLPVQVSGQTPVCKFQRSARDAYAYVLKTGKPDSIRTQLRRVQQVVRQ